MAESKAGEREPRVTEIDLLRFLAAASVMLFHYAFRGFAADGMSPMAYPLLAPAAKYGYLGVELFFMISGFVILMTALDRNLRGFVVSRVVRLFPAFWACCTITFLLIKALNQPAFVATWRQYFINMFMVSEFVGVQDIDGSYWSLFVEMRFYFLIALILAFSWMKRAELLLVLWLLFSIAAQVLPTGPLYRLLIVEYSAYFIAGATCYLILSRGVSLLRLATYVASGGLAIYTSIRALPALEQHYSTTMSRPIVAGCIALFFVTMFLISVRKTGMVGRTQWRTVGALTYPLYLLHANIGFLLFNVGYPAINSHLLLWTTVALMIVTAYLVNHFVEVPLSPPLKRALNRGFDRLEAVLPRFKRLSPGTAAQATSPQRD